MPTGYTSIIEEKEDCTLRDYALRCARAFGAYVRYRDTSFDAEVPTEILPDPYHLDELYKEEAELKTLRAMTLTEAQVAADKAYKEEVEYRKKNYEVTDALRKKYEAMREAVDTWIPPTGEHERFKKFMREQLDTGGPCVYETLSPDRVQTLSAEEWLAKRIASAEQRIKYHKTQYSKEVERAVQATNWIQMLLKSLE